MKTLSQKNIIKAISLTFFFFVTLSCGNKKKESMSGTAEDIRTKYTEYVIFHGKLKVSSPVKPLEEDATNTVSKFALTLYSDIKKYTLMSVFDSGGIIGITVSEFKETDSTFSEHKYFNEILTIYKNNAKFKVIYGSASSFKQDKFNGFKTRAKLYTSGKESSMMYVNLMSNKKIMITSIGIYDKKDDENVFENIVGSIKTVSSTSN